MIRNAAVALGLLGLAWVATGCDRAAAVTAEPLQGVVELDTRTLSFEVSGRIERVTVAEGDHLEGKVVLAALDESLLRPERDARAAEVEAQKAQLSLLEAGARGEEMRAVQAEINAVNAQLEVLRRQRARRTALMEQGALGSAQLDELDAQESILVGRREVAQQKLKGLRSGARAQEIEAARARVRALEAGLAAVDARLARFVLSDEGAGEVLEVHAKVGEVVAPGAPLVTLADLDHPFVDVFVPQSEIAALRIGMPMSVRVDSLSRPLSGTVERIGTKTEFTPRFLFSDKERENLVIRVRVRVEDPKHLLTAGVPAFVTPRTGER